MQRSSILCGGFLALCCVHSPVAPNIVTQRRKGCCGLYEDALLCLLQAVVHVTDMISCIEWLRHRRTRVCVLTLFPNSLTMKPGWKGKPRTSYLYGSASLGYDRCERVTCNFLLFSYIVVEECAR